LTLIDNFDIFVIMDDKFYLLMVDKFISSGIAELDFNDGTTRLVLRKENTLDQGLRIPAEGAEPALLAKETPKAQPIRLGIAANAEEMESGGSEKIKSPIVATFYASPGPDAPPFVKAGSLIKTGQALCILEAMKMMNHLEAEFDCEIMEIHASNGELVEYGEELFTVKRI